MRSSDVTFKQAEVPIETRGTDDNIRQMDIIEIKYPDGKVVGFPADMKSPETGIRYRDMYQGKYKAFKNGEPDPDRVETLEREIAERQAELDGMRNQKKGPDDERLRENLGYGDRTRADESDHDNTKRANTLGQPKATVEHEPFDQMTKDELNTWIAANSDEHVPSVANKDELVKLAKKVERKQKAAA